MDLLNGRFSEALEELKVLIEKAPEVPAFPMAAAPAAAKPATKAAAKPAAKAAAKPEASAE